MKGHCSLFLIVNPQTLSPMKQLQALYRTNNFFWFVFNLIAFLAWTVTTIFMMSIIVVALRG
jgi:hypothetical protein